MKKVAFLLSMFIFVTCAIGKDDSKKEEKESNVLGSLVTNVKSRYTKEMVLGSILKGALENMHLTKKKANDDLSEKAFKLFLERLDYGKQFLLEDDVEKLEKFEKKIDDELVSGKLEILKVSDDILKKRIAEIQKYVFKILEKPFDLTKEEKLETDAKKREFLDDMDELKDFWRRQIKYDVMVRVASLREEQEQEVKKQKEDKKNKKKTKKVKILSEKELEIKARQKISDSYKKIFARLTKPRKDDNLDKFYNSITRVYDPHTHYLIPEEKEDFDIDMSGELEGIGAILREDGSYIKVVEIVPGSASWKGKELAPEDTILKVGQGDKDPIDVVDMGLRDAVKLIRGKKGTEVKLTIKKPDGLVKEISIIRDVVKIEESYVKGVVLDYKKSKVGYIIVPKFYRDFRKANGRNCSDDVRREIEKLKKKGVQALILDLRNNGGGALEDARLMSGLFIDKGPIVQVKAHTGEVDVLKDVDGKTYFDKPVIVLINRHSASASEIVAAALQDYGRAIIVGGEHSHGKGTVQAVVDLDGYSYPIARVHSPLGALKITIQMFYRITGGSTQYKGVTPDIILPDPMGYIESGEKYLDYSIPWQKVKAQPFKKWPNKYNLSKLRQNSEERVKKNQKFKKISDAVKWYTDRKEDTKRSLLLSDFEKRQEENRKKGEEFKIENENKDIKVESLVSLKRKVDKEKFEEFSKNLQKDPYIEESILIIRDVLN